MPQSNTIDAASAGSPDGSAAELLRIDDLVLRFGGVTALDHVSLSVRRGELLAVIGPNGAGKSSVFNCINGIYRPETGRILLDGRTDLVGRAPHHVAAAGIARTFQNLALFDELTVVDNLMAARTNKMRRGALAGMLWLGPARREELRHRSRVEEVIDFLDLTHVRQARVSTLPYGWRKRVEIGRALCMDPRLLLLDEPVAGMNQEETEDVARYLLDLAEGGSLAQILVEHNLEVVMDIADRIVVLDFGKVIADGAPEAVAADPAVKRAYLGERLAGEASR